MRAAPVRQAFPVHPPVSLPPGGKTNPLHLSTTMICALGLNMERHISVPRSEWKMCYDVLLCNVILLIPCLSLFGYLLEVLFFTGGVTLRNG